MFATIPLSVTNTGNLIFDSIFSLALFLFGIKIMSDALKDLAGSRLKKIIGKATKTPLLGMVTGFMITAVIQSSSAVTAIVIGLISAGLLSLPQAIAIIFGADIGTTFTSVIIGLDIFVVGPYLIIFGAIFVFFFHSKNITNIGRAMLGFGFLFFGLDNVGSNLSALFAEQPFVMNALTSMGENSGLGILVGIGLTIIIQSSSAFIGIVQRLYMELSDSFTLIVAVPLLMGSNIGTTFTGVLSSLSGSRDGKRAAIAHVFFNVIGTIIFWILLVPIVRGIEFLENNVNYLKQNRSLSLAIFHVGFNILSAAIFFFFINFLVKIVEKMVPLTDNEKKVRQIERLEESLIKKAPPLALENAYMIIVDMSVLVKQMYDKAMAYVSINDRKLYDEVLILEDTVDNYDQKLHDYLAKLNGELHSPKDIFIQTVCFDTVRDLERIADHAVNLVEFMEARYNENIKFHDRSYEMVNHLLTLLNKMLDDALLVFEKNDLKAAQRIRSTEPLIDELEKKYRRDELILIANGEINYADLHFVDILANLERIGDHANNIAANLIHQSKEGLLDEKI